MKFYEASNITEVQGFRDLQESYFRILPFSQYNLEDIKYNEAKADHSLAISNIRTGCIQASKFASSDLRSWLSKNKVYKSSAVLELGNSNMDKQEVLLLVQHMEQLLDQYVVAFTNYDWQHFQLMGRYLPLKFETTLQQG